MNIFLAFKEISYYCIFFTFILFFYLYNLSHSSFQPLFILELLMSCTILIDDYRANEYPCILIVHKAYYFHKYLIISLSVWQMCVYLVCLRGWCMLADQNRERTKISCLQYYNMKSAFFYARVRVYVRIQLCVLYVYTSVFRKCPFSTLIMNEMVISILSVTLYFIIYIFILILY